MHCYYIISLEDCKHIYVYKGIYKDVYSYVYKDIYKYVYKYVYKYKYRYVYKYVYKYKYRAKKKNRLHQRYDLTPKDFSVFIDTYFLSIVSSYSLLSTTATFNINLSYSSLTTNLRVWCFSRSILDLRSVK